MQGTAATTSSAGSGESHYGHSTPVPMDLHMPQPFSYYSCIMDNNAMFAAQQAQYNKMYGGLDNAGGRRNMTDEIAAQGTINTRILELRKEKSRDAARSRRGKENFEFYELAKMLPLPGAITSQLDKASIIRLTIAYLRLREFAANGNPTWIKEPQIKKLDHPNSLRNRGNVSNIALDIFEEHEGTHILQSLDGFAISLNSDGRFLYISETVSIYLGLSQVELTGSSVFDYIHQSDHAELAEQIGVTLAHHSSRISSPGGSDDSGTTPCIGAPPAIPDGKPFCYPVTSLMHSRIDRMSGKPTYERAFCVRMKSTLTKRGCHFKSSGYRVVLLLGKLRPQYSYSQKKNLPPIMGFIGLAIALPPPSVHEVRLESDMFVTKLTFDFKIAHCEPKVSELLDYAGEELTGVSMYSIIHAEDMHRIKSMHEDLLNKGQVMSNYYRLINKIGGYTWMQSCATLVCNTKNADEQSIICVNYVLSGPQDANIVMDERQLNKAPIRIKEDCDPCDYTSATNSPRDKVYDTGLTTDKLRDKSSCELNGNPRNIRPPNGSDPSEHNMYIGPEHDVGQTFLASTHVNITTSPSDTNKRGWRKRASSKDGDDNNKKKSDNPSKKKPKDTSKRSEGINNDNDDENREDSSSPSSSLRHHLFKKNMSTPSSSVESDIKNNNINDSKLLPEKTKEDDDNSNNNNLSLHSDFNDLLLYKQRKGPSFPTHWMAGSGGSSPLLKQLYGEHGGPDAKADSFSSIVASYQQAAYGSTQPAQPVPLKPAQLYGLDQYGYSDHVLYPHHPSSSFHLYHHSTRTDVLKGGTGSPNWYPTASSSTPSGGGTSSN